MDTVAPVRERGLKFLNEVINYVKQNVAPVRERGLKCKISALTAGYNLCRSREGAWIEMTMDIIPARQVNCRSREGAWIEIDHQ